MSDENTQLPASASASDARVAVDDGQHMAKGAAANGMVLLASNFRALFTFLIARILGEAALGRFGLAFATTELLSKAGMLGFDNAVIPFVAPRAVSGDRAGALAVFRRMTMLALVASTFVALAGVAVAWWMPGTPGTDGFTRGGMLMLLALPGIAVARIATGASRSVLAMSSEFYSRGLVETWVTIGVFVGAVALGLRDTAPALAVVLGSTAAAVAAFALAAQALRTRIVRPGEGGTDDGGAAVEGESAWRVLRFSLPIAGASLLTVLVMRVDVLLLGAYVNRAPGVTVESFGVFCAAAEIAGGLRKVRQVFDPIFAPIAATRAVGVDRPALRATVAGPGRWVLAAQLPLVGALVLAGGSIMSLYGAGFRAGALWLGILGLAHGTNAFAGLVETLLMLERPSLNLLNAGLTVIVQLVAGLLLIPRYGVTGAAVAMCLGFAAQGVLRFAEVRRVFGWSWPWRSLARPLVAGGVAFAPAAVVRMLGTGTAIELISGGMFLLLYVLMWLWLGPDPSDREVWTRLLRGKRVEPTPAP